ncbi:Gfo/Idh/MocA family oxidoreductase [Bullifex sp.]|uniref:Gfo/Idh/MocA family protein n=1 Tax=Bullifex sp. TaxID=2815808 RepID=UPI002A82CCEE|nr:Gfo/Idh/MocA family oxidoreductase [Bullifex sp.]MDY4066590.1 Gfo/Idh/MocA family oxidoreductase [Bullifex sp.]
MKDKITIAIAGLGSRGRTAYGAILLDMKDRAQVVAIADFDKTRCEIAQKEHNVKSENVFSSVEEMLSKEKLADAVLICTQDRDHVRHALMALDKGYDILLEKPVSPDLNELKSLVKKSKETGRKVLVCHVLRYTPFFQTIKKAIDSGRIGKVATVQALENVRYWHQAHSFVRGNWRRKDETSPMILAKCCHDLDYLIWLCGSKCKSVSSYGSLSYFKAECAPEGAALRCLDGCKAKAHCPYDAEKIYLTNKDTGVLHGNVEWPVDVLSENPTEETIRAAIEKGPYGRCVFHCDNDVVDNQIVAMEMESGATVTLTMSAFTSIGGRTIKVMGTLGDIQGDMHDNIIKITEFGKESEIIDLGREEKDFAGHGGGDQMLIEEFVSLLEGGEVNNTVTTLEVSVESHLVALAAEESRLEGGTPQLIAPLRG